jgi:hypothetical protein
MYLERKLMTTYTIIFRNGDEIDIPSRSVYCIYLDGTTRSNFHISNRVAYYRANSVGLQIENFDFFTIYDTSKKEDRLLKTRIQQDCDVIGIVQTDHTFKAEWCINVPWQNREEKFNIFCVVMDDKFIIARKWTIFMIFRYIRRTFVIMMNRKYCMYIIKRSWNRFKSYRKGENKCYLYSIN